MAQQNRFTCKLIAMLLILALMVSALIACGDDDDKKTSATPASTSSPAFQQQRAAVIQYLEAYNEIDNSFTATITAIQFPDSGSTAEDIQASNMAISQLLTACDTALSLLNELKPPPLTPETTAHLQQTKTFLSKARQGFDALRQAASDRDQPAFQQALDSLSAMGNDSSAINKATEQLLLTYRISDTEVNYQFRSE